MNKRATEMRGRQGVAATCMAILMAFAGFGGVQAAEEKAPAPVDLFLQAKITISPEGWISELAWLEADQGKLGVARLVEPKVRSLEFVPGALNGVPATTETALRMMLRATPMPGGNWEIAIRSATTGAATEAMGPPRYPPVALQGSVEAEVVSDIEIDAEGRATVVAATFESGGGGARMRNAFVKASEQAIAGWRFVPERVGGHAVAGRMRVPISFCLGGGPWCQARALERTAEGIAMDQPVPLDSVARLKTDLTGAGI